MTELLAVAALIGLLAAGFVLGDYLARRRDVKYMRSTDKHLRDTLEKIQAVHNAQVQQLTDMADRLGGLEMHVKGVKR